MGFIDKVKSGWNAFLGRDPTASESVTQVDPYVTPTTYIGAASSYRPDRVRLSNGSERTIINSIYNRISIDVSSVDIQHVKLDENKRFMEEIKDGLNSCLTISANKDQTARAFIQDIVLSMFDEGCISVIPIDTTTNPKFTDSYDILSMRVGSITEWYPDFVKVKVYNDRTGQKQFLRVPKSKCAIIENPFYSIMNARDSTMQRLKRKLTLLDIADENNAAGKLDLIIQLPYTIHSQALKQKAESRRKSIEDQLTGSKYGIAYADATEKITQLNRAVENNLKEQIDSLTEQMYTQLSITPEILNGSANEQTMINYNNRTVEPILAAIVDEFRRKFLTKTARTQGQSIIYFKDPFKLVPVSSLADIADKFTRNEIMSPNEIRQVVGMKPSEDPNADELRNRNISQSNEELVAKGEIPGSLEEADADGVSNLVTAGKRFVEEAKI